MKIFKSQNKDKKILPFNVTGIAIGIAILLATFVVGIIKFTNVGSEVQWKNLIFNQATLISVIFFVLNFVTAQSVSIRNGAIVIYELFYLKEKSFKADRVNKILFMKGLGYRNADKILFYVNGAVIFTISQHNIERHKEFIISEFLKIGFKCFEGNAHGSFFEYKLNDNGILYNGENLLQNF